MTERIHEFVQHALYDCFTLKFILEEKVVSIDINKMFLIFIFSTITVSMILATRSLVVLPFLHERAVKEAELYDIRIRMLNTMVNSVNRRTEIMGALRKKSNKLLKRANYTPSYLKEYDRNLYIRALTGVYKRSRIEATHVIPWGSPLPRKYRITSWYGMRRHPVYRRRLMFHFGVDLPAKCGVKIRSTLSGRVVVAGRTWRKRRYGKIVTITNKFYTVMFAHMSRIYVRNWQKVKKGQVIGRVGKTGVVTGCHLHYGLSLWNTTNPAEYMW